MPFTKAMPFNFNELEYIPKYIELLNISIICLEGLVSTSFNGIGKAKVTKQRDKSKKCPIINYSKKYRSKKLLYRYI